MDAGADDLADQLRPTPEAARRRSSPGEGRAEGRPYRLVAERVRAEEDRAVAGETVAAAVQHADRTGSAAVQHADRTGSAPLAPDAHGDAGRPVPVVVAGGRRRAEQVARLGDADDALDVERQRYERGLITKDERTQELIAIWIKATNEVAEAMNANFPKTNPIFMMVDSGARKHNADASVPRSRPASARYRARP
ncbi:hypothetical protein ABZU86_11835 [Streptomyces sp. NPDC005271]|uniref:hypothetical protein n=1 Tax=unclassified Streptomyces TaxID=2593676 RepID=UPI0033A692BA